MAIQGTQKLNINQSDDSSDYKASFYHDALFLIVAGHKQLVESGVDYFSAEEEHITGDLTEIVNEYINSSDWAGNYRLLEEQPENVKGKKGKHRQRVDILCILTSRKPHLLMKFEAKRLKSPGFSVGKYVGKTGIGEFISGNYASESDTVGMLGYIQSDDCGYWEKTISNALLNDKKKELHITLDGQWKKANIKDIDNCHKSRHGRPIVKRELEVYHLLLDFVK